LKDAITKVRGDIGPQIRALVFLQKTESSSRTHQHRELARDGDQGPSTLRHTPAKKELKEILRERELQTQKLSKQAAWGSLSREPTYAHAESVGVRKMSLGKRHAID